MKKNSKSNFLRRCLYGKYPKVGCFLLSLGGVGHLQNYLKIDIFELALFCTLNEIVWHCISQYLYILPYIHQVWRLESNWFLDGIRKGRIHPK